MSQLARVTFPTILTLVRLIVSPFLMPFFLVYFLPIQNIYINTLLALLFVTLSLTDFFDGYLARKFGQESDLGRQLDPIADKFLIYSTLIALLAVSKIYFWWVVVLIGREFFIMGLRHIALEHGFAIRVSLGGKVKTTFQVIFLTLAIVNPAYHKGFTELSGIVWNGLETVCALITLGLSVGSAYAYFSIFWEKYRGTDVVP